MLPALLDFLLRTQNNQNTCCPASVKFFGSLHCRFFHSSKATGLGILRIQSVNRLSNHYLWANCNHSSEQTLNILLVKIYKWL